MNDDSTHCEQRLTTENPPLNTEIESPAVVGGNVPEIKPVKGQSFVPTQGFVKTANYNSDYSDVVDTDDEINEAQRKIDASNT